MPEEVFRQGITASDPHVPAFTVRLDPTLYLVGLAQRSQVRKFVFGWLRWIGIIKNSFEHENLPTDKR
jgi:hypothetical protein